MGRSPPTGKLPLTFYKEDWLQQSQTSIHDLDLDKGLGRTYRYLTKNAYVKHWFGFGLSYSQWVYSNLRCLPEAFQVKCHVTLSNIGNFDSSEVVQLYGKFLDAGTTANIDLLAFEKRYVKAHHKLDIVLTTPNSRLTVATPIGTRVYVKGRVKLFIGGGLPFDEEKGSGGIFTTITLNRTTSPS